MACTTCYVVGLVRGSGHMPSEDESWFGLSLQVEPDASPEEAKGVRELTFEGEITEGNPEEGYLLATGDLVGRFSRDGDGELREGATVEVYSRDGQVAFINLVIQGDFRGPMVAMGLKPSTEVADAELVEGALGVRGWMFMGRQE